MGHARFFVPPDCIDSGDVKLSGETAHQILRVLRLEAGDTIILLDNSGRKYHMLITSVERENVYGRVVSTEDVPEPETNIVLAQCLLKGDKTEMVVQKAVELGASRVQLITSERTIAKMDENKSVQKTARLQKIAKEAAEQCDRSIVPQITEPIQYARFIEELPEADIAILAWEEEISSSIKSVLGNCEGVKNVVVCIGPEGGFSTTEAEMAKSAGMECVHLGKRILRAETAAVYSLAVINYELEMQT